jgi:putative oxidoreductase
MVRMNPLQSLNRFAGAAPVVVRLIVGTIMTYHGWMKLTGPGPAGVGEFLAGLGLPIPAVFGYLLTFGELLGGLALILGLFTRVAALALTAILVCAVLLVKLEVGLVAETGVGAELDLALIAGFITLALLGPGRPSLDHSLGFERAS